MSDNDKPRLDHTLQVGKLYTLTEDVTNPEPDRRHRIDWRKLPTTEKGTRFIVRNANPTDRTDLPESIDEEKRQILLDRVWWTLERIDCKWPALYQVGEGNPLFAVLIPRLKLVAPTIDDELREARRSGYPVDADDLVHFWIAEGKLTRDDLTEAIAAVKRREAEND